MDGLISSISDAVDALIIVAQATKRPNTQDQIIEIAYVLSDIRLGLRTHRLTTHPEALAMCIAQTDDITTSAASATDEKGYAQVVVEGHQAIAVIQSASTPTD